MAYSYDKLKEVYTIEYAVEDFGGQKKIGRSLRDKDNNIQINIKDNNIYDYRTNKTGDVFNYVSCVTGLSNSEAKKEVEKMAKKRGLLTYHPENPKKLNSIERDIQYNHNNLNNRLNQPVLDYLINRGISKRLIEQEKIGYYPKHKKIIFPIRNEKGEVINYKQRVLPRNVFNKLYPNEDFNYYDSHNSKYMSAPSDHYLKEDNFKVTTGYPFGFDKFYKEIIKKAKNGEYLKVYITEGIPDALTLREEGFIVLCLDGTGTIGSDFWNNEIIPLLKKCNDIVFCGDNDDAGKNAVRDKIINYFIPNGITNFKVIPIPRHINELLPNNRNTYFENHFLTNKEVKAQYPNEEERIKDINEFYIKNNYSIDGLEEVNGLTYLAKFYQTGIININDKNETIDRKGLYPFINEVFNPVYREISKGSINRTIKNIEQRKIFEEPELEILKGIANDTPEDKVIVNEILREHKLIYNKGIGFYEFNGKVWEKIEDDLIEVYINKRLGLRFYTAKKQDSVLKGLASDSRVHVKNPCFNRKNAIVFENGTLYLTDKDTIEDFKPNFFDPDDRMTLISPFSYNHNATCPKWNKFITDVMEPLEQDKATPEEVKDAENKKRLLQEFAGYILFSDCHLQKMLVLTGGGSNGKSVFYNTIENLFDSKAVTTVHAHDLRKPHEAICLKDSLLNVAGETKENLAGCGEMIKDLADGALIKDRELWHSPVQFTPRAKWILSLNNPISSNDSSNGFDRRFIYVSFGWDYITDKELAERSNNTFKLLNPQLVKELKNEELPGIFNWVYEGYKRLKKNDAFTETIDDKKAHNSFKLRNNNILAFLATYIRGLALSVKNNYKHEGKFEEIIELGSNEELFEAYNNYCERYRRKYPYEFEGFKKETGIQIKNLGLEFTKKRTSPKQGRFTKYFIKVDDSVINHLTEMLD